MTNEFDLFISPHPDDVVYSAFSVLTDGLRKKTVIIPFNVSRFTRFGLRSKPLVTFLRTLEDRLLLAALRCHAVYLFVPDSLAQKRVGSVQLSNFLREKTHPVRIIAPMAIGGHVDHMIARRVALDLKRAMPESELTLYEDMPYAASSDDLESEEDSIVASLSMGLMAKYQRMDDREMARKVFFSRLYLTQTDKTDVLVAHARSIGACCASKYAERFFQTGSN